LHNSSPSNPIYYYFFFPSVKKEIKRIKEEWITKTMAGREEKKTKKEEGNMWYVDGME